ncbi:uncharacterized protein LOC131659180 [Vicia villosa]|uniref:uncharacterized protein LOC131659180 n=1 Tax=Vicia villosa TaxID=3911 RepID=UPI00273C35F2|nr:uncharacterized protein LOC131659180 [Vicia villosa]
MGRGSLKTSSRPRMQSPGWSSGKTWKHWQVPDETLVLGLSDHLPKVGWKGLVCGNRARPRAVFMLWMTCNKRLATKDRLAKFGSNVDRGCAFCNSLETLDHMFFDCRYTKGVWEDVLRWLHVLHVPQGWNEEIAWLVKICKSRNWRGQIMKMAIAETIYETWWDRNLAVHSIVNSNKNTAKRIIDNIVYRVWGYPKFRRKLAQTLMP